MLVKILGAGAGGGFPQWNCNCPGCQKARRGEAKSLTQSSIAVRSDNGPWFLINASPDVRQQLEMLRTEETELSLNESKRSNPFAGIILTDGEIDHTTGLILLRESAQPLKVYSTYSVKRGLTTGYPLFSTLQNYCGVEWFPLKPGESLTPINSDSPDLDVEVFPLSTKPPKYMQKTKGGEENENEESHKTKEGNKNDEPEIWGIGLTFRDRKTGGVLTYTPGLGQLNDSLQERFANSNCILVDGTFWQNEELPSLGIGSRTAFDMGHLPLSGDDGCIMKLSKLKSQNSKVPQSSKPRKILVHINNTNPILIPNSPEHQVVKDAGIEIGYDGLTLEI
ncbi:pyrroloquinoline quinone biosynthesis protein PqqB [Mastigocoleus sp. MO_188.B34]|uniref:pyrroloquinoline quinone biosynthesis protein PqqB n=1 Tax=Mastigocoleus sp. MO_188.B34 TaxID=3036635 RepID=UPI0026086AA2|nr:pyrroloquinoline quinone biosynthesis protein PqqB [Mastigocoleus sp. MO_188.B34]MDJ0694241.1 pyrroloquinoline quinone biosynthesis protein PqqB [Mastigocoleus sp. MO_188.B34]